MAQSARGLTPADLIAIREGLASGKRPRVVFTSSAGQMAGNAGHVVELADPDASDEWIVVQFGRDQLPFSPADLAIPSGRGRGGGHPRHRAPGRPANPEAVPVKRTVSAAASKKSASLPTPRKEVTVTEPAPVQTKPVQTKPVPTNPVSTKPVPTKPTATHTKRKRGGARRGQAGAPAEGAGVVGGHAGLHRPGVDDRGEPGARALAKPHAIKPTEALRMIALIDVPGVHDAVENIIAAERIDAQQRAVRLREELAELESRLAELNRS
jgi:hypothetical protein